MLYHILLSIFVVKMFIQTREDVCKNLHQQCKPTRTNMEGDTIDCMHVRNSGNTTILLDHSCWKTITVQCHQKMLILSVSLLRTYVRM